MLNIVVSSEKLRWSSNGNEKEIVFEHRIRKCLELSDSTGMAIIFDYINVWEKNTAIIMNLEGSIRKRVLIPPEITSFLSFYDVYYEGDNLAFILNTTGVYDIACLFDNDGNYIRHHFTK